ncbi:MAG TPA: DNA recombination protein RmuC [Solirubrobacteraceae bacterium]|jgi:DNA recombination protein RmuC
MDALFLAFGVIIGAALMVAVLRPRLRTLTLEAAEARDLENRLVKTSTELEQERARAAEQLATVSDAQERLSASFKAMSADALQSSMSQLTELARVQLHAAQTEVKGDMEKRHQAVEQLVAPLKEQLGRVDSQLLRLDQERRESRGQMSAQLRTLAETSDRLRTETSALVTALRKPNARGQWGQMQLRNVVEAAGMLKHCDFVEQHSYAGDEATLRPDMVINLPGGKHVVVDAKSPLQGMLDAHEARDGVERDQYLRDHARLLRKHVKALADKGYWARLETTPDMVVMFLPIESLLGPALDADPTLMQDAMTQRVLIATPTTLLALLYSVAYGWQQERVAESAQEISELGRELHGRLVKLSTLLGNLGTRLNRTVSAFNETIGSYESRVLPSARRFADHGAVSEGSDLPELEPVTVTARTVQNAALQLDLGPDLTEQPQRPARRLRAAE